MALYLGDNTKLRVYLNGVAYECTMPLAQNKEPIAYLYNGVQLPKLPEWDRVAYPYAVIVEKTPIGLRDTIATLYCYPLPMTYRNGRFERDTETIYVAYSIGKSDVTWDEPIYYDEEHASSYLAYTPFWSNFDILNEDGTLYLAASEPTPVYE